MSEGAEFIEESKRRLEDSVKVVNHLLDLWLGYLTPNYEPKVDVMAHWVVRYGASEAEAAILIARLPYTTGRFGRDQSLACERLIRYVGAIMRNREDDRGIL